ncbi:hypothetical protein HY632_04345 [Candidatus Uhrbacteria bacterium]|nr:hypothetical protein [Candidatus Uhrbacteria bacterium]
MGERLTAMEPQDPHEPSIQDTRTLIAELVEHRKITRDQERIAARAFEDPTFAILANRTLLQGTDPELLRQTIPESVNAIAAQLGLTPEQAAATIATAHRTGPGSLPIDSAAEWLWLILAKFSINEAGKPNAPQTVLAASARMIVACETYANENPAVEIDAREYRDHMLRTVQPIGTAPLGADIPLYADDLGFYVAYRTGHHVAAVRSADGLTFYGTDASLTLADAGIAVDKPLSPVFGIVFPK